MLRASLLFGVAAAFCIPATAANPPAVSARVDVLLAEVWREAGVLPGEAAGDREFVRRAYLDLTGCIPRVGEQLEFLQSDAPNPRAALVDELLRRPAFAKHLADTWTAQLMPQDVSFLSAFTKEAWRISLQRHFADNTNLGELVSDILRASGSSDDGPFLFYFAGAVTPEALAARTARSLLGVELDCAQCHDHPFEPWKREDFWQFAAFFAHVRMRDGRDLGTLEDDDSGELYLPGTKRVMHPRYLRGEAAGPSSLTRREQLAGWVARPDNPYFARATVNTTWRMLFGSPLVERLASGPGTKPDRCDAVLDVLAEDFIKHRFALRRLVRVIANTRAYQTTSRTQAAGAEASTVFARMPLKIMTAEQLHTSLQDVIQQPCDVGPRVRWAPKFDLQKMNFVSRMTLRSGAADGGEVQQVLALLNGDHMTTLTDPRRSPLLKSLLSARLNNGQAIETLFLAALSRPPTTAERRACSAILHGRRSFEPRGEAYAHILWALLNTAEFRLNH